MKKKLSENQMILDVLSYRWNIEMHWDVGGLKQAFLSRAKKQINLYAYQDICFICGHESNLKHIHGKCICKSCIDELIR